VAIKVAIPPFMSQLTSRQQLGSSHKRLRLTEECAREAMRRLEGYQVGCHWC